jgi:hypothetical protein
MQIFLSYPSELRETAERIQLALRAGGHEVFFDRSDLAAGREYDNAIVDAVGRSDLMVFLITPEAIAPGRYTLTELKLAERRWRHPDGHVLPVMIQQTSTNTLPPYLQAVNILMPSGNVAAETAHEVARLAKLRGPLGVIRKSPRAAGAVAVLGLLAVAGIAAYKWSASDTNRPAYVDVSKVISPKMRAVVAGDSNLIAVLDGPPEIQPFSTEGVELGSWAPPPGTPVLAMRTRENVYVATTAPDAIVTYKATGGARIDSIGFDVTKAVLTSALAKETLSSNIESVAVAFGTLWIVTGNRDGDPNVFRLRLPERQWVALTWPESPDDGFGSDARGLRLRRIGTELWAITSATSPASIYRIVPNTRVDEFRGHALTMISCATDIGESVSGNLLILSCDNDLQEIQPDGRTLKLLKTWRTLPSESGPNRWTSEIIERAGESIVVALNTEDQQPSMRPAHLRIVEIGEAGAAKTLLDLPDAIATSLAVHRNSVAVIIKRTDGTTGGIIVPRDSGR